MRKAKPAGKSATRRSAKASPPTAYIVSGEGTDAEILERCAKNVEGWDKLGPRGKSDMVRLMREFHFGRVPPRYEVKRDGAGNTSIRPPEEQNTTLSVLRVTEAFASVSVDYVDSKIGDLADYHERRGGCTSQKLSASVGFVHGGKAEDTVQSALLVQMAATHDAAMRALGGIGTCDTVQQAQLWSNLSGKLLNAFTRQAETLAKLQRGGEQVIKHVHIDNRGGQAVLAEQVVTGGVNAESGDQPYGQGACGPALLGENTIRDIVPMPRNEGPETLPNPRRSGGKRSAEG